MTGEIPETVTVEIHPLYGDEDRFTDKEAEELNTFDEALVFVRNLPDKDENGKPLRNVNVWVKDEEKTARSIDTPYKYRAIEFLENRRRGIG